MKHISIILFILTLLYQEVLAQVKSFDLRMDKSVENGLNSTNVIKALKIQFNIPENYELKQNAVKGTANKMSETDDLGYVHERYTQYYKGIKIEHSDIRVRYLNGLFVSANGEYIDVPNIDISIALSKEDAIEKAKNYIGAKKYVWEDEKACEWLKSNALMSCYPDPEIVICRNKSIHDTLFYVAYKVNIRALEPFSHDYIYIDAKNGNILNSTSQIRFANGSAATRYSGTRSISTQQNGNAYRLRGYDNNRSIETYNMQNSNSYTNTDFIDNDNNWTAAEFHNANKDDAGLEAHWCAMMTWDYFKQIHGQNSFNNNGATIKNNVNANLIGMGLSNNANAFWDGGAKQITYGSCVGTAHDSYVTLDVVPHEFGHGLCEYTADLVYSGESGAINESLSDIWGACVENYVNNQYGFNKDIWLHREEVGFPNRSLMNPNDYGQPDTYGGGSYWTGPNAGVHTNSGIMNYWFYLLSVGRSGTNGVGNAYNIVGIGINKAEKIVYRAEKVYMTANTNFANARTHTIQAAIDLYGDCSQEVLSVTNAWHAVGVGGRFSYTNTNISNITYVSNTTITACNITLNNVKVQNNAKLTIEAAGKITINAPFEVELGSALKIKVSGAEEPKVIISELLYDTPLSESSGPNRYNGEFVTIYNYGDNAVDVSGWSLVSGGSGQSFTFPSGSIMEPGAKFYVAYRNVNGNFSLADLYSGFQLGENDREFYQRAIIHSNAGEGITLHRADDVIQDSLYYDGTTGKQPRLEAMNQDGVLPGYDCVSLQRANVTVVNGVITFSRSDWTTKPVSLEQFPALVLTENEQ
jgi:Zn-dependent metalloprotease